MVLTPKMLFYGGRLDSVTNITGNWTESAGVFPNYGYDTDWSDARIKPVNGDLDPFETFDCEFTDDAGASDPVTVGHTMYSHWYMYQQPTDHLQTGYPMWQAIDSAGFPWFRLMPINNHTWQLQRNSGTGGAPVWTAVPGTDYVWHGGVATITLDVSILIDAGGNHEISFYSGDSTVYTVTASVVLMTDIAKVRFGVATQGFDEGYSQLICTQDLSTIAGHVKTLRATGAGFNQEWNGVYTDVNEQVTTDANFNQAPLIDLSQTYQMTDFTLPVGYTIYGVSQRVRVKNDAANSPLNIKSICRSGGTNYVSADLSGVGGGYAPAGKRYPVDPATSVTWTQSGVNAVQFGFKSAT